MCITKVISTRSKLKPVRYKYFMKTAFHVSPNGHLNTTHPEGLMSGFFSMPGMVNAHSHSFQRAMRGLVETKHPKHQDNFWSWREMMYAIASKASPDDFETLATWCFLDCLKSGFTEVGEFHYVHHRPDGTFYQPSYCVAERIARAARKVGIRLTLLHTAYHSNGPGISASPAQRQFIFPDAEAFLEHVQTARAKIGGAQIEHGVALHSIRACPREWMKPIAAYAKKEGLPIHVHAAEQTDELKMCQEAYGMSPIALLNSETVLGKQTTVVHGTHVSDLDIELLAQTQTMVCICPSTERNLGDGMAPIESYLQRGIKMVIGTDSHARIDVVDELRSLEDHERLRLQKRLVWLHNNNDLVAALTPAVCAHGYASLGKNALKPKDRVLVEIPEFLDGCAPLHIAQNWLIGGSANDIKHVFVGTEQVIHSGKSTRVDETALNREINNILKRLI